MYIYPPFAPQTQFYCTCPLCAYHQRQWNDTTITGPTPYVPKHRKPGPAQ